MTWGFPKASRVSEQKHVSESRPESFVREAVVAFWGSDFSCLTGAWLPPQHRGIEVQNWSEHTSSRIVEGCGQKTNSSRSATSSLCTPREGFIKITAWPTSLCLDKGFLEYLRSQSCLVWRRNPQWHPWEHHFLENLPSKQAFPSFEVTAAGEQDVLSLA